MKSYLFIIGCIILIITNAFTQSAEEVIKFMENPVGVGVKAQAMGNAFTAVADNYTALYWNPAGLTQLKLCELYCDISYLSFSNDAQYLGNIFRTKNDNLDIKSFGVAYKYPTVQGNLVIAFGLNRFKDFDEFVNIEGFSKESNGFQPYDDGIPFDKDVYQIEETNTTGNLSQFSFGGGVMISPNASIGASICYYYGKNKYYMNYYQEDTKNNYQTDPDDYFSYEITDNTSTRIHGLGLKIGTFFTVNKNIQIGITYDIPTDFNMKQTYDRPDVLYHDNGDDAPTEDNGTWEYIVRYPAKFTTGIALNSEPFLISGSIEYQDWTTTEFKKPGKYGLDDYYQDLFAENPEFRRNFRETFTIQLGGEMDVIKDQLKIQAGFRRVPSYLKEAKDDLAKNYYSIGGELCIDRYTSLHMSYTMGDWKRYSTGYFTPSQTYEKIKTDRVMIGVQYRFKY